MRRLDMGARLALLGCLGAGGCMMHMSDPSSMWSEEGREVHQPKLPWPTIRIDGPSGARFTMKRGVFGEGLDARAPFQGVFQPTGDAARAAYRFDIQLDEATARRYGSDHAVLLEGTLTVPQRLDSRGVLRIAPTECAMRALVTGGVDELSIESDAMPTPDLACARTDNRGGAHAAHRSGHGWHEHKAKAELTLSVAK